MNTITTTGFEEVYRRFDEIATTSRLIALDRANSSAGSVSGPRIASMPQHYGEVVGRSAEKREEGWGGAALVLGLFGLIAWCCPIIGVVIGGLALVFGIVSLGKGGGPMAIIGLILGIICLVLSIFNALLGMALMLADAEVVSLVMTDL